MLSPPLGLRRPYVVVGWRCLLKGGFEVIAAPLGACQSLNGFFLKGALILSPPLPSEGFLRPLLASDGL